MAVTTTKKKAASGANGYPAQYSQPSRKGKKAWRKYVDIEDVETGLEEIRTEERETGSKIQSKTNDELFQIDVKGDEEVRKRMPKFDKSQLSYNKALAQRSAVPAVSSRSDSSSKKRSLVSSADKDRLLRIGKKKRLGPFNSIEDPTKLGQGSALLDLSHAVKESGKYDVWNADDSETKVEISEEKKQFLLPLVEKPSVKAPTIPSLRSQIEVPAVCAPHQGTSYNPSAEAHEELLNYAYEKAEDEARTIAKLKQVKDKMEAARRTQFAGEKPGVPTGMVVDSIENDETRNEDDGDEKAEAPLPKKIPARKTKQQRRKAEKLKAEKRTLAEKAAKKRFLSSLHAIKSMRKSVDDTTSVRQQESYQKHTQISDKLRKSGLAGQRIGKHVVQEGSPDVQLKEDLAENLRSLKVEGNLFRDRYLSLQHRARLEPRVPVIPKKRGSNMKEVEKFAWKRFE